MPDRFGSPHLKSFRMLCVHFRPNSINRRCVCQCKHLQVQGKYTKASATCTAELCSAIALDLAHWIWTEQDELRSDIVGKSEGLESLAINDLALSADWCIDAAWNFSKRGHINLLEEASLLRLAQRCAHFGWDPCLREDLFYLLPDLQVKGSWRRVSNGQLLRELTRNTCWNFPLPMSKR